MTDLLAVYDFEKSQISFDFFTYLALADLARREAGSDRLSILLVPAEGDGFGLKEVPYDLDQKRWRLRNLVVDGAALLPSCAGVLQATSRDHARVLITAHDGPIFPPNYSADAPTDPEKPGYLTIKANYGADTQCLRASAQARSYAQQWLDARRAGRKPIALTLRESKYADHRNVTLEPWARFAGYLTDRGYFPFILRDIDTALDVLPANFKGITDCPAPVFNIDLRLAFYELCYLNVFVLNGPQWLCCMSRYPRFIAFSVGSAEAVNSYYEHGGGGYNEPMPMLNHLQRVIWHDPELPTMIEAFESMEERLQRHEAAGCPEEDHDLDPAYRRPAHMIAQRFANVQIWQVLDALIAEVESRGESAHELYGFRLRAEAERLNLAMDDEAYRRAVKLRSEGNDEAAIPLLLQLVARRPTEVEPYVELGLAFETLGRIGDAETLYRTAISRQVASSYVVYRLGCITQAQGNLGDAQACFELLIARNEPGDDNVPHARRRLADVTALLAAHAAAKPAD